MHKSNTVWANHALTEEGWQSNVRVDFDETGKISTVESGAKATGLQVGVLVPALANLHSHAFQRAIAGLTEYRGHASLDSFWTWRDLMYRFVEHVSPDQIQAIAAFCYMEMLEAGYAAVGEFHYLHHQSDGKRYTQLSELAQRIVAAAELSGIGLTVLPVLYQQGGCDGRALLPAQNRFGSSVDEFTQLFDETEQTVQTYSADGSAGIAAHSIRAVSPDGLNVALSLAADRPIHIHIAEQDAEVQEVLAQFRARPVEWLLNNYDVNENWCLVHATHMDKKETVDLAKTGAVVGLCPITEANLGDGIFNGSEYHNRGGRWGIGTDSNLRISVSEELRMFEYSQRLSTNKRAIIASQDKSTGRVLFDSARYGGAQALQRLSGRLAPGYWADLLALNFNAVPFVAADFDTWLDSWIFASDDRLITDVWSAGRHLVKEGKHIARGGIQTRYMKTMQAIKRQL